MSTGGEDAPTGAKGRRQADRQTKAWGQGGREGGREADRQTETQTGRQAGALAVPFFSKSGIISTWEYHTPPLLPPITPPGCCRSSPSLLLSPASPRSSPSPPPRHEILRVVRRRKQCPDRNIDVLAVSGPPRPSVQLRFPGRMARALIASVVEWVV